MAVLMMGGDEKNPMFHDFLGMSSDDNSSPAPNKADDREMEAEASVNLSSEGLGANNSEIFHFHGRKNVFSDPEASSTLPGRKRSISSAYMSLLRDRMLPVGLDSHENSRLMKTFGKEVVSEQLGKSHDDEPHSMQLPPRPTSSILLHPPVSTKPSLPMNLGSLGHSSSRFGQTGASMERISSSYTYKDVNVNTRLTPQAAADEGSRTGMKGSGILNIINSSSSALGERNTIRLPYNNRLKAPQMVEPEASNMPSCHNLAYPSRQMTIFYAGQAHVFDDVNPNKADVIMALAGSSGVSWSTNCSLKPGMCSPASEAKASGGDNEVGINNLPVCIPGVPDRGLVAQAARIPLTNDLQSLIPGSHQGSRTVRDPRVMTPAAEPDTDGKRDV